jgi:hypothetical protein
MGGTLSQIYKYINVNCDFAAFIVIPAAEHMRHMGVIAIPRTGRQQGAWT